MEEEGGGGAEFCYKPIPSSDYWSTVDHATLLIIFADMLQLSAWRTMVKKYQEVLHSYELKLLVLAMPQQFSTEDSEDRFCAAPVRYLVVPGYIGSPILWYGAMTYFAVQYL